MSDLRQRRHSDPQSHNPDALEDERASPNLGRGRASPSLGRGRASPSLGRGRGRASPGSGHTTSPNVLGHGLAVAAGVTGRELHWNVNGDEQHIAATSHPMVRWMRNENNRFFVWLSYLLGILSIHSAVMAPLKCAFQVKDLSNWALTVFEVAFFFDVVRLWICIFNNTNQISFLQIVFRLLTNPRTCMETLAICTSILSYQWKYMVWVKIIRALRVKELFEKIEKCQWLNYSFIRFLKLMSIQIYCTHIVGCMVYHLATRKVDQTWISHIKFGDQDLTRFGIGQKYIASIYFAIVTLSTVGYGDIYAVNVNEMIAVVFLIIFSLIVWSYLGINLSDLFVRRSRARIVRDKLDKMEKHLKAAKVTEELAKRIRDHMVIKYNDEHDKEFFEHVPPSIGTKVSRAFYESIIMKVSLFNGCSTDFIKHLVTEVREDFYAPGYKLFEAGSIMNQLCILFSGELLQLRQGIELPEHVFPTTIFGLHSVIFNDGIPNTFQACKTSKILILHKHFLIEALEMYLLDAYTIMENMKKGMEPDFVEMLTNSEFGVRMQKDEVEKASLLNRAIFARNIYKIKTLVLHSGVNVNSMDYNKRSPLHVAATRGNREITTFLIQEGAHININIKDSNGNSPLLEAIINGQYEVATVLIENGASFGIDDVGEYLCEIVSKNDLDLLKGLLRYGIDPNAKNDDGQTPLHIAAAKGRYTAARELLSSGAICDIIDRWGHRPIDEAIRGKHMKMVELLEGTLITNAI